MALRIDQYAIGPREPDLAIFFPYPWGGDRHNNRQLLREIALLTGGLVIGAQTPGTGQLYVNRATRRGLQPEGIRTLASDYAGEVRGLLDATGYPVRLLAADSGRVTLGALMQLSEHRPFTHVQLRDGTNQFAPERALAGVRRLLAQPGRGELGHYGDERKTRLHRLQDKRSLVHGRVEMLTQVKLQCSTAGMDAVRELAGDPRTPVHHTTYRNGICGTVKQQLAFASEITQLRAGAGMAAGESAAPLIAAVEEGNHADLGNPLVLFGDIQTTLALTDFVCRSRS